MLPFVVSLRATASSTEYWKWREAQGTSTVNNDRCYDLQHVDALAMTSLAVKSLRVQPEIGELSFGFPI